MIFFKKKKSGIFEVSHEGLFKFPLNYQNLFFKITCYVDHINSFVFFQKINPILLHLCSTPYELHFFTLNLWIYHFYIWNYPTQTMFFYPWDKLHHQFKHIIDQIKRQWLKISIELILVSMKLNFLCTPFIYP